jgi:hypothetical protein
MESNQRLKKIQSSLGGKKIIVTDPAFGHHHQAAMATRHQLRKGFLEELGNTLESPLYRFILPLIQDRNQFPYFLQ